MTGLKPYINENPYNLSYSYRKFVTIAAAIAADPDVFVFDEPTACQDRHGIRLLSGIINALSSEGKLVITITHDMEFVAENFDRTVCMADKHILMDDKTNRILTDDSLMEKAALKNRMCHISHPKWDLKVLLQVKLFLRLLPKIQSDFERR